MLTEISNKIIMTITEEKKIVLKERIQRCLEDIESNVDINFEDNYHLYFGGKELEVGVFVRIEVYNRKQDKEKYRELREQIREIYVNELSLTKDRVFVQFDDYEE